MIPKITNIGSETTKWVVIECGELEIQVKRTHGYPAKIQYGARNNDVGTTEMFQAMLALAIQIAKSWEEEE